MPEKRATSKGIVVKRTDAREALRNAKKVYDRQSTAKPKAWKKGGHEWSKVLGHFGVAGAHKK